MDEHPPRPLEYGLPPPPERPLWEVGCAASALGSVVCGIVLPFGGCWYAAYVLKDMGGPLFWPIAAIGGAVGGAVFGPLICVPLVWITRRIRRRRPSR